MENRESTISPPPSGWKRHGDRLRLPGIEDGWGWSTITSGDGSKTEYGTISRSNLEAIASLVDQDAGLLTEELDRRQSASAQFIRNLHRGIEQLVKELRHTAVMEIELAPGERDEELVDIVDAEIFLVKLKEIFGEPASTEPSFTATGSRVTHPRSGHWHA